MRGLRLLLDDLGYGTFDRYRLQPGEPASLSERDPGEKTLFPEGKDEARQLLRQLNKELEHLQELLYAEGEHRLLVVLQAMDSGGKDGTIRHVFEGVNPQGVRVAAFKKPTAEELAHDYLWRVHKQTPRKGEIVIFNRSHYEDVLVVRVHELVPEETWTKRYDHINDFERLLTDEGATILKFFLQIDLEEQKERFQDRLDEPHKRWKFNPGDLEERALWPDYMRAYEDALTRTSSPWAPWYIIPANRKWYRNLLISSIIIDTLRGFGMRYPEPAFDPAGIVIE